MDNALAGNGLTTPQYAVLAHLRESPGLSNAGPGNNGIHCAE
jgi:hypothetical protein